MSAKPQASAWAGPPGRRRLRPKPKRHHPVSQASSASQSKWGSGVEILRPDSVSRSNKSAPFSLKGVSAHSANLKGDLLNEQQLSACYWSDLKKLCRANPRESHVIETQLPHTEASLCLAKAWKPYTTRPGRENPRKLQAAASFPPSLSGARSLSHQVALPGEL